MGDTVTSLAAAISTASVAVTPVTEGVVAGEEHETILLSYERAVGLTQKR